MGASAKRKREKKQDFAKPKLKVGKTSTAATNATHTSFKARSIVLNQQSLSTSAPTLDAQFSHQLSLCASKTDSQRRDALGYMINTITGEKGGTPLLPLPVASILPKIQPLILDISNSVRAQLMRFLRVLPQHDVVAHVSHLLLYVRAGMTHLAYDIRVSSLEVLEWLLHISGQELVGCAGGWLKTLNCFLGLLGWMSADKTNKWSSTRSSFGKPGSKENKLTIRQLNVLAAFLDAGFRDAQGEEARSGQRAALCFPLCSADSYVLYARSNPFRGLNLFGAPRDAENTMYDDAEARKRAFDETALRAVARGIQTAKKEGGEVGRAASGLEKVLVNGMGDFDREME